MPEETKDKDKGRDWEQKRTCSYCNKSHIGEELGFVHNNEKGNPDWSVCFPCTKKTFDKVLGKESKLVENVEKCNYCDIIAPAGKRYFVHVDENNNPVWIVCFNCVKKAFDNILKGEK